MIEPERIHNLNSQQNLRPAAYVAYWMQAAQRARDNHALTYAAERADALGIPLLTVFVLSTYPSATSPHYRWMLSGLHECALDLRSAGIGFSILRGEPVELITEIARDAAMLVCDRSPVRWSVSAKARLAAHLPIPVVEVDGESVIPESVASPKQEWSARTFRLKVSGALDVYTAIPGLQMPCPKHGAQTLSVPGDDALFSAFNHPVVPAYPGDRSVEQIYSFASGTAAAEARLKHFLQNSLDDYDSRRNDPTIDGTSGLSAYLHFGQISAVKVARQARKHGGSGYPAFVEQLVVRRELCRNYTRYRSQDYDAWEGLPAWSRAALEHAAMDSRAYTYPRETWEAAATHDQYWNAAQNQLVRTGTIHNYMRMYWGKMLLAWSVSPQEAFQTALYLNDHYALDGRDPNGWAGVAWCFGLHDRPWPSRAVFGTVRSMVASGLKKKFDADAYARAWAHLPKTSQKNTIQTGGTHTNA